nr:hypothetical protein DBT41_10635 [Aerococcus urinae]
MTKTRRKKSLAKATRAYAIVQDDIILRDTIDDNRKRLAGILNRPAGQRIARVLICELSEDV